MEGEKVRLGEMGSKYRCVVENRVSEKYVQIETVSGRDLTIITIIMAAGKGGVRKEEI